MPRETIPQGGGRKNAKTDKKVVSKKPAKNDKKKVVKKPVVKRPLPKHKDVKNNFNIGGSNREVIDALLRKNEQQRQNWELYKLSNIVLPYIRKIHYSVPEAIRRKSDIGPTTMRQISYKYDNEETISLPTMFLSNTKDIGVTYMEGVDEKDAHKINAILSLYTFRELKTNDYTVFVFELPYRSGGKYLHIKKFNRNIVKTPMKRIIKRSIKKSSS